MGGRPAAATIAAAATPLTAPAGAWKRVRKRSRCRTRVAQLQCGVEARAQHKVTATEAAAGTHVTDGSTVIPQCLRVPRIKEPYLQHAVLSAAAATAAADAAATTSSTGCGPSGDIKRTGAVTACVESEGARATKRHLMHGTVTRAATDSAAIFVHGSIGDGGSACGGGGGGW